MLPSPVRAIQMPPPSFLPRVQRTPVALALGLVAGLLLRPGVGPVPDPEWIWIAPAPLLWLALSLQRTWLAHAAVWLGALVAASAYTGYLRLLAPWPAALLMTVGMAAPWWLVIVGSRRVALRFGAGWTVLAYPLLWAGLDLAMGRLLPDGQWGSAAYSQAGRLPLLQLAALGGTPAVLFVLSLPASALALLLVTRWPPRQRLAALLLALPLTGLAFGYGALRLHAAPDAPRDTLRVGLASIDDAVGLHASPAHAGSVLDAYARLVAQLAAQGAALLVLPEKIAVVTPAAAPAWQARFAALARRHAVWLEVGIGIDDGVAARNQAWLFGPDGHLHQDYEKLRLAPPERIDGYRHGSRTAVQEIDRLRVGLAICKDMHFASVGHRYGRQAVDLMLVPAWDFAYVDAWMGARMTLVRGVENGHAVVRAAREGLLTVSDGWGRVVAETSSAPMPGATLVANLPLATPAATPYARIGDLFGLLCAIAALALWLASLRRGHAPATTPRAG